MQELYITQCILSLASNFHAEQNLALAHTILSQSLNDYTDIKVQAVEYSPVLFSQDKNNSSSANSPLVLVYHNQIAWLSFASPVSWKRLHDFSKSAEWAALRHKFTKPIVSLDIDILAIYANENRMLNNLTGNAEFIPLLSYSSFYFYESSPILSYKWYGITRRFPLASYDRCGINYLLNHQFANNLPILPIL